MLLCYSDTHLDDLKDSLKEYRDADLKQMGKYVKDNYFLRDQAQKITTCYLASPIEAFYSKDYELASK